MVIARFIECLHVCALSYFSYIQLFAILWTIALQAPLFMGFSRQECWSGLPCPPPGDLPNQGTEFASASFYCMSGRFFTHWTTWEAPLNAYHVPISILVNPLRIPEGRNYCHSTFSAEETCLGKVNKWANPELAHELHSWLAGWHQNLLVSICWAWWECHLRAATHTASLSRQSLDPESSALHLNPPLKLSSLPGAISDHHKTVINLGEPQVIQWDEIQAEKERYGRWG